MNQARAYAVSEYIKLTGRGRCGVAAKAFLEGLPSADGYDLSDPAEELAGLDELMAHLRCNGFQPGKAGSLRASIQCRLTGETQTYQTNAEVVEPSYGSMENEAGDDDG